jgi:hypothetical protein
MAWLVPDNFDLRVLANEAERRVVRALLEKLSKEWLVLPQIMVLNSPQNAEIDVLIASKHRGVYLIEVKGGLISLRDGTWYAYDKKMPRDPFEQLATAKHQLVRRMKSSEVDLHNLIIREIVAMPDVGSIPAVGLGPGAPRESLFCATDLEDPEASLAKFVRPNEPVPNERFLRFVRTIRPTVKLEQVEGGYHQTSLHRIDEATRSNLQALVGLADNQRFLVTGAAGTGKTFLAEQWARRCASRNERTALLCYNRPLGDELRGRAVDTGVLAGAFHTFARELLSPLGYTIPPDADSTWWDTVPAQLLIDNVDQIPERFDSIVIDEGQDFRPTWMQALEALLDPAGPRRLLIAADPLQAIYGGPWRAPAGVPSTTLSYNVRSSASVGRRVEDLGGVAPNPGAPDGPPVRRIPVKPEDAVKAVRAELNWLRKEFDLPASQIAVLTRHRILRDALISAEMPVRLARWNSRDEETVLCETIHRVKGLEKLAVVVVDVDAEPSKDLEYIGSSRAILHLSTITRA